MKSVVEAKTEIRLSADAIGLVGVIPPPPVVADGVAVRIVRSARPPAATFLPTSEMQADDIAAHVHRIDASIALDEGKLVAFFRAVAAADTTLQIAQDAGT